MIKKLLDEIIHSMNEDIRKQKWLKFLAKFTAYLAAGGCAGYTIGAIIELLIEYRENIVFAFGALIVLLVFWIGFTADKPKVKKEVPVAPENNAILIDFDIEYVEATYKKLRYVLYYLLLDNINILNLRKPASPSQLDAPVHYDVFGVNTIIYHYLAFKAGEVKCEEILRFLEKNLGDKLANYEVDGFQPDVICGGATYPSIMLDDVRETGDFVLINLVIPTDEYLRHRQRQLYRRMISSSQTSFKDKDF